MSRANISPLEMSQAWEIWRDKVSDQEREAIANTLVVHDTTTFKGTALFLQALAVEMFRGRLSPVALQATQHLIDQMLSVLWMAHQQENAAGSFQASATGALLEMSRELHKVKLIQPTYTVAPDPENIVESTLAPARILGKSSGG
jgi:hypothetical protein